MKLLEDALTSRLDGILNRAKSSQGAAARIYPLYQQLQTKRFSTQNASEGKAWAPLQSEYAKYKLKRYGKYPGGGRKLLIATSTLAGAVIGPGSPFQGIDKHVALFKPYSLQISVQEGGNNAAGKPFNYPSFVANRRPFMDFSKESIEKMKSVLTKYLIGG